MTTVVSTVLVIPKNVSVHVAVSPLYHQCRRNDDFAMSQSMRCSHPNGVVGDTLRAFVNGRGDDWDRCLPLVDFAINNSESAVAAGMTPFFIDRGEHPRLPLSHGPTGPTASRSAHAARMRHITEQVRALLLTAQRERKELHDQHRREVTFQPGDQVLLATRQLTELAQVGK